MLHIYVIREMQIEDTTTHCLEWPSPRTPTTSTADKDREQQELSFIAGKNVFKQSSHFGRQIGNFLPNSTYSYHTIQQSCSLVFTKRS